MSALKPCIVRAVDKSSKEVLRQLAIEVGFELGIHVLSNSDTHIVFLFGKFDTYHNERTVMHDNQWPSPYHFHWPRFDAVTDMAKLRAYWELEPEFDETPLPQVMNEDQARETRKKFNLSEEQWDAIPPLAQQALAGTKVKVEVVKGENKWIPVSEPNTSWDTVFVTNSPVDTTLDSCGIGYFEPHNDGQGNEVWRYTPTYGCDSPTHWTPLPESIEQESDSDSDDPGF